MIEPRSVWTGRLRWSTVVTLEVALFSAAAGFLGYWAFAHVDSWLFQTVQRHRLEEHRQGHGGPAKDGLLGRIDIPRLGVSSIVVEGVGDVELRRAVGHLPGTALFGEPGNVAVAGHRDTHFRGLRNVREGDRVVVTTPSGTFRYVVRSTRVVDPRDPRSLEEGQGNTLTLVTCFPFNYTGAAPLRFIVRAEEI